VMWLKGYGGLQCAWEKELRKFIESRKARTDFAGKRKPSFTFDQLVACHPVCLVTPPRTDTTSRPSQWRLRGISQNHSPAISHEFSDPASIGKFKQRHPRDKLPKRGTTSSICRPITNAKAMAKIVSSTGRRTYMIHSS